MPQSPKRSLVSTSMVMIATLFFGCGMMLGMMSTGICQAEFDSTMKSSVLREHESMDGRSSHKDGGSNAPKVAWLVSLV